VDISLADPNPVSVDTLMLVVALGFVGFGAYRLFSDVGTLRGALGWGFVGAGWLLVMPRWFLSLELDDDTVRASLPFTKREIPLDEVTDARTVAGILELRGLGLSAPRFHWGTFKIRGEAKATAYTSRMQGPFVLLERRDDRPALVSPAEPERFVEAIRDRQRA
jgi:hypothetical protein